MPKLRPTGCGKCRRGQDVQESANQKRLLLFSEHLSENMLLKLPHRQFVFTLPKLLRLYFKYDRNLFQDVSRIIFSIIQDFYNEAAPIAVKTAAVVSYQSFGDLMRWNPHYHCDRQDVGNVDGAMEGGRRRSFWKAVSMRRALFTISL